MQEGRREVSPDEQTTRISLEGRLSDDQPRIAHEEVMAQLVGRTGDLPLLDKNPEPDHDWEEVRERYEAGVAELDAPRALAAIFSGDPAALTEPKTPPPRTFLCGSVSPISSARSSWPRSMPRSTGEPRT
jgi:hypothetical protein